jgi:hypothetical protein
MESNTDVIAKIVDIYGQVSFMPCSINKVELIYQLVYEMERIFGTLELSLQNEKFVSLMQDVDDFSMERAITELEN